MEKTYYIETYGCQMNIADSEMVETILVDQGYEKSSNPRNADAIFIDVLKKEEKKTIVFSGGDPLWFGIGRLLIQNFPLSKIYFEPAATSFQLAFSRLGKPWQNTQWISLHGRDPLPFEKAIKKLPSSLVVLTDSNRGGAKEVYQLLHSLGLEGKYEFWTFERLGYENERITKIN